jgi:hypothetical protein
MTDLTVQGKVNKSGSTETGRTVDTNNKASRPGSRGNLLSSDPERLRQQLTFVQQERERAEETVKLQRQLEKERE